MKIKLPGKRILPVLFAAAFLAGGMGKLTAAQEPLEVQEAVEVQEVQETAGDTGEICGETGEGPLEEVPAEEEAEKEGQDMPEAEFTSAPGEAEEALGAEKKEELSFSEESTASEEIKGLELFAGPVPQTEGTAVTAADSEYHLVTSGSEVYKGNYNLLGDVNNKDSFVYEPFNEAGSNVVYQEVSGVAYFVPKNTEAAGKYGFLVQNVGFSCEKNCALDMRFTVTGYKNYTLDRNGDTVSEIYPAFGFWKEYGLSFAFSGPDQNVRVDILEHGTNNPVQGNYSFRWLDIDAGQRFGMSLVDGELTGRYAVTTCTAYYQNSFPRFKRTYQMVNAAQHTSYIGKTENWMDGTVYWEVKNCSGMNLLFAAPGSSTQGRYWENTYRTLYEQCITGVFPDGEVDIALLSWDGESYGPRENPSALYKYVSSREGQAGESSNTLSSGEEPFYYLLSNYVPVEAPAYYYDQYTVTDTLPLGVDYDGAVQVLKGENGADVTGWFDIQAEQDTVTFTANHTGAGDFYGSTYIFRIRAKMNTGELMPSYQGDQCIYTVQNTGRVSSRHKTETEAKTAVSNTVTTVLAELGKGKVTIKKTSEEGKGLDGAVFEITAKEEIRSPSGELLVPKGAEAARIETVAGTAVSEELYAGKYLVREILPPEGFSLNPEPVEVLVCGPGNREEASPEAVFQNKQTLVFLKKVSELTGEGDIRQGIPGVAFCVWNKESMTEKDSLRYETDESGQIALQGYVPGTYCFREVSPKEGYVPDERVREFVIDERGWVENEHGHIIQVENTCIKAGFLKTDKATGEPLSGAELQLSDQNGRVVDTWISGPEPHRIDRIPQGTYFLTELHAPEGYQKGKTAVCVIKPTAELQRFALEDVKYVTLKLTKILRQAELVQGHGTPVFTFEVTGTDLDGKAHTYYEMVEFGESGDSKDSIQAAAGGEIWRTAELLVPAGRYTVRELETARYRLESMKDVENGTVQENTVIFDLSRNQDGAASFINKKINDEGLSDTDFIRNTIIPIKELKNTAEISERCHMTDEPIYITKNGYGDMVIMSMENYERTMKQMKMYSELDISENQIGEGRVKEARKSLADMRKKYGL